MRYGRTTSMTVTFRTEADRAAQLLPASFRLDEPLVSVLIVQCEDVDWLVGLAYNLIGVDVSARFDGERDRDVQGTFCVVMWENMTEPILGVRDHSGVPKVYASIPNQRCRGSASRLGHPILESSATGLSPLSADQCHQLEDQKRSSNWMNLKYFPNVHNDGADVSRGRRTSRRLFQG